MVLDPASRALATNRWRLTVAVGDGNALEPRRAMAARKQRSSGKPMKDSAPDEGFLVVSSNAANDFAAGARSHGKSRTGRVDRCRWSVRRPPEKTYSGRPNVLGG